MKKPRTKASIIKWVLLSILAVILIAALVIFFYVKYKIFPKIDGYMNDPEIVSMLEELQQEDLSGILESIDGVVPETTQAPVESPLPTETAPATQAPISQTDV